MGQIWVGINDARKSFEETRINYNSHAASKKFFWTYG